MARCEDSGGLSHILPPGVVPGDLESGENAGSDVVGEGGKLSRHSFEGVCHIDVEIRGLRHAHARYETILVDVVEFVYHLRDLVQIALYLVLQHGVLREAVVLHIREFSPDGDHELLYLIKGLVREEYVGLDLYLHLVEKAVECKGDALREHEETMKIYKAHGMSPYAPLKGCLWVLLQLPVLIALFQLIGHAYPLRQAHFLWIADLAQPDRLFDLGFSIPLMGHSFNLLPCLMAVTQALTIRFSSSGGSGGQRGTMLAMTLFFFVLFYSFPSGLMLYWMASNLLQVAQQAMIKPAARTPSGGQAEPTAEGAAPAKP